MTRAPATPPRLARPVWIAAQVAALLGALALAGGLSNLRDYVESSPRFCTNCHEIPPELALWTESEHRQLRCQQCHHQSLEEGLRVLGVLVAGMQSGERHAVVDVRSCSACHESHDPRWPSVSDSPGHSVHAGQGGLACTQCHGRQMHFGRPPRETCAACHQQALAGSAHEQEHCLACHDFLTHDGAIRPGRADCLACHERAEPHMGATPMHFDCTTCHRPHRSEPVVGCGECHRARDLPGLHQGDGHDDCHDCHTPHRWTTTAETCVECHAGARAHAEDRACRTCHGFDSVLRRPR